MESEDVDVIFENSVLHQALQETGMGEVETEPRSTLRQERQVYQWRDKIKKLTKQIVDFIPLSWQLTNWRFLLARIFVAKSSMDSLHFGYQKRALMRLQSSPLLCKDDEAFLELYITEELKNTPCEASSDITLRKFHVSWWKIYLFSIIVLSMGMLWAVWSSGSSPFLSVLSLPGFYYLPFVCGISMDLLLLALVPHCLGLSFLWAFNHAAEKLWIKMIKDLKQADESMQTFEKTSQDLAQLTVKCLRFIKESELVAKGFLVARPTSHTGGSPCMGEPHHWCPRLRHLLFDGNSQMVKDVKETVSNMHKCISLTPDFEVLDDSYLQQQDPYFEFLRSFDEDTGSDGNPHCRATEPNFPLNEFVNNIIPSPRLSALVLLFRLHLSYFVRGLYICFYREISEGKRADFYPVVIQHLIPLTESMNKFINSLKENQDFYRASFKAAEQNPNRHAFDRGPKGLAEDLYRCVNSLDIRLQSVADRALKLRIELEKKVDEEDTEQVEEEGSEDNGHGKINSADRFYYEETLRQIKIDLDLCIGCNEESLRKLDVRERQEPQSIEPVQASGSEAAATSSQATVRVVPLKEPVIVDEVFEATIEADNNNAAREPVQQYRRFTEEEREQMREQREDIKRFSRELHAVVGQRAIIQRQREEVALARVQGRTQGFESLEEISVSTESTSAQQSHTTPSNVSPVPAESLQEEAAGPVESLTESPIENPREAPACANDFASAAPVTDTADSEGGQNLTQNEGEDPERDSVTKTTGAVSEGHTLDETEGAFSEEQNLNQNEGTVPEIQNVTQNDGEDLVRQNVIQNEGSVLGGQYPTPSNQTCSEEQIELALSSGQNQSQSQNEGIMVQEIHNVTQNEGAVVEGQTLSQSEGVLPEGPNFSETHNSNQPASAVATDLANHSLFPPGVEENMEVTSEGDNTMESQIHPSDNMSIVQGIPPNASVADVHTEVNTDETQGDKRPEHLSSNTDVSVSASHQKVVSNVTFSPDDQAVASEGPIVPEHHASSSDTAMLVSNPKQTDDMIVNQGNNEIIEEQVMDMVHAPQTSSPTKSLNSTQSGPVSSIPTVDENEEILAQGGEILQDSRTLEPGEVPQANDGQANTMVNNVGGSENVGNESQTSCPELSIHTHSLSDSTLLITHSGEDQEIGARSEAPPQATGRQVTESYSLLAVKLTTAENLNSNEEMQELLPGAKEKIEALNAAKAARNLEVLDGSPTGDETSRRRTKSAPQQPYIEGWRSSVQKTKDMHWAMCERILKENLGALGPRQESESDAGEAKNYLDNYNFSDLPVDEEFFPFFPENIEDIPSARPTRAFTASQADFMGDVNTDGEDFQNIKETRVSRHHFTASERDEVLNEALKDLEYSDHFYEGGNHRQTSDDEEERRPPRINPNPNRRRHNAARHKAENDGKQWVNITHLEVNCHQGSHFSIIREKDVTSQELRYCPGIPSPDPCSSFNASLALMAATRAHSFLRSPEEEFVGQGDILEAEGELEGAVGGHPENRFDQGALGGNPENRLEQGTVRAHPGLEQGAVGGGFN